MADIKFSEFPKANQSKDSDEIAILQDGVNKMIPSPVLESKVINKTVSRVIEQGGASLNVINLKGVVPTYADLALITPTPELNDAYQVEADGLVYVYTENGFQAEGEGFLVQPQPNGVVEEGNTEAVSGGEVFRKSGVLNIDRISPLPSGQYYNPIQARLHVPTAFRKKGVTIEYSRPYGLVRETLNSDVFSNSSTVWDKQTDFNFVAYSHAIRGNNSVLTLYLHPQFASNFIRFGSDLVLENIFVLSGTERVAQAWDVNFNYLGDITKDGISAGQNDVELTYSDILAQYPTVYHITFNGYLNRGSVAYVKSTGSLPTIYSVSSASHLGYLETNRFSDILDIDKINPLLSGFHTRTSARNSLPMAFRKKFVKIRYQQSFGEVIETFVGSSTYNALAGNWERVQDQNFIGHTNTRIDRLTGNLLQWGSNVFTSKYVLLAADLTIENYYALSGTKDVCFVYDEKYSYLGAYTDDAVISGQNEKYLITLDAVRLIYPSATFIRLLGQTNKGLIVYNTISNIIPILHDDQIKFDKINYDYLYELGYYTSKIDGRRIANAGLKTSDPMRIVDRDNLIINGYSNPAADRPLIVWFDKDLNFIGSYSTEATEYVYNRLITADLIPDNAVFAIVNCTPTQVTRNDGLDTNFGRQQSQDITVYSIKDRLAQYLRRSDNPNPVNGGRIKLVNYLGNVQNIHPKVLYFPNGWNGYNYWMAYTPYPYSITTAENPSIAVSHDGEKWFTPDGLTNPIEDGFEGGYNSDTHLVYRSDTDTLECWYRPYDIALNADQIVRKVSSDGINWGATEVIFDYSDPGMLSPSIIFEEGKYKIWYNSGGDVMYIESVGDSVINWSARSILPIDRGDITFWHSDVIRTDLGLEFVIHCKGAGDDNIYYINQKPDGSFTELKKIIERGDDINDDTYSSLYRPSILKINGIYSIYYSGISTGFFRSLLLTKGRDVTKLRGVNL